MTDGCLLCEMEQAAPSAVVFRDELWAAEVAPGYEVPGWFFLRVRRHAERRGGAAGLLPLEPDGHVRDQSVPDRGDRSERRHRTRQRLRIAGGDVEAAGALIDAHEQRCACPRERAGLPD